MHNLYVKAAWGSTACLGWLWCSAHWPQVHMVQRPAPGPPPPAGGSAAGPPAPVMQGVPPMMPGMAVPFSSQSQVGKWCPGKRRYVKQWQQVIPLAVALNVKNIVNTSTYSILSLFLADRWPISKISTIQWLQLLWIDSHFMIGICTCTSCHDTSLSDTTQTLQQSILATASYRQVLHIAMPDFMTGGWGPGRWGWFTSLRLSKLFRSKATYKEWGIELHHGLRM